MSKSLKENEIKEFDIIEIIPSLKGGLRRGRKSKNSKGRLWICDECGLDYTTKRVLRNHQEIKHKREKIIST